MPVAHPRLVPGAVAPDFTLPAGGGGPAVPGAPFRLDDAARERPVLLVFVRGTW